MSWLYSRLVRPLLFTQDAERAHGRALHALAAASKSRGACSILSSMFRAPELPVDLFGLNFPNPLGLAAGMDKYAEALPAWETLGFGFAELGGVTWHTQPGNDRPRLFRAVSEEAIVNRMGFNNPGAEALARSLATWRDAGLWPGHPVGINLGKSKITPLDRAAEDYANSFRVLRPYADFFVINVSSPNTPNLRKLQDKSALDEILSAIQNVEESSPQGRALPNTGRALSPRAPAPPAGGASVLASRPTTASQNRTPLLIKVAPDLSFEALDEILELALTRNIAGLVATNTTTSRPASKNPEVTRIYQETGGLSGKPLRVRSTEIIRHLYRASGGKLPIIGVGGIFDSADAWEKITAGASLLQVYTGFVFRGPGIAREIISGLRARLAKAGMSRLSEAVGTGEKLQN